MFRSLASAAAERTRTLPERHGGIAELALHAAIVLLGLGLRLDSAINPDQNPGRGSIVAYQGNDSRAYEDLSALLYETGRYGTPKMRSASDWSPGAPFFYAGVYFLTGGVHPTAGRIAAAFLGALMILLI